MNEVKFEIGDRAVVNSFYDPTAPENMRQAAIGMQGFVSGKVNEYMLWFMPDTEVPGFLNDFGQWAVTAEELDKLEA